MKVRKGTKSEVALEGVATCTARGLIVPIVSISSKIDASTCFLSPSLHLAVGVHEDGRGQSAGEDFRGQIFKVSLSFFCVNPVLRVSGCLLTNLPLDSQTLPESTGGAVQLLHLSGRPLSPRLRLRGRYHVTLPDIPRGNC